MRGVDYVVFACDGLFDVVNDDEVVSVVNQYKPSEYEDAAARLVDIAWYRGSTDNVSVMIFTLAEKA